MHTIATDMTFRTPLELADGRKMTVVDIQAALCEIGQAINEKLPLPADERLALDEWISFNVDLRRVQKGEATISILADRVGWASRYHVLNPKLEERAAARRRSTKAKNIHDDEVEQIIIADRINLDLLWDRVVPIGLGERFSRTSAMKQLITVEEIDNQLLRPPSGTRAEARYQIISNPQLGRKVVGWSSYIDYASSLSPHNLR
jgi:hypothetical protein